MSRVSQGLKGGLAAGAIYGGIIGLLHLSTLLACSAAQIHAIQISPGFIGSNQTASSLFYDTDIVYYPMVLGLWAFVYGVIFGAIFSYAYARLPGGESKTKGLALGIPMFFAAAFVGPGYLLEYSCSGGLLGGLFPWLTFALTVPAGLVFGYLLGTFYDSFGRLEKEQTEERQKEEPMHWSELFKRKEDEAKQEPPNDESPSNA